MFFKEKTDRGRIRYGENIIGSIARRAIEATDGRAVPSDVKGRQLRGEGASGAADDAIVDAAFKDDALNVTIYILVRFGSSVTKVCEDIDRAFRAEASHITGVGIGELTISVKGLLAKNVSKRNIEVTTHAVPRESAHPER
ncbi:MAG: Asp23/Gls24 family envelope stress response protein [Clostridiales Family XIII bacterium]|jgi:uncharacterized alkaline shock family protein YloU|nr:Asp23/Gls24 family envelope stress response protein [Clostridiales Family XIII bacterium]